MTTRTSNKKLVSILLCIVLGMFAFGYALVPIYNVLCEALGINGKTDNSKVVAQNDPLLVDKSRNVKVQFIAMNNEKILFTFKPLVKTVSVHPGENKRIEYLAQNNSKHEMTIQAIPSVSPAIAAKYLRKTECFCFTQQTLARGEKVDMPLLFYLDKDLPKNIHTVTLAYTIFDTEQANVNKIDNPHTNAKS